MTVGWGRVPMTISLPRAGAVGGAAVVAVLWLCLASAFAVSFPALTGRIVDMENIVPVERHRAIDAELAELEVKSGIQLVVAALPSLGGESIETYARELFDHWRLGEKARNGGVLLLVAPNQRRVRIQVGYGLRGRLTDAEAASIINHAIAPRFRVGDYGGGIARGVEDIITVLTIHSSDWHEQPARRLDHRADTPLWAHLVAMAVIVGVLGFRILYWRVLRPRIVGQGPQPYWAGRNFYLSRGASNPGGRRFYGGFFGGGGSPGGGGSSGGASGSW